MPQGPAGHHMFYVFDIFEDCLHVCASPVCALILQQSFGLLLANNDSFDLRWVHVDVEFSPDKKAHDGCKLGLGFQNLRRLFLDDEGAKRKEEKL